MKQRITSMSLICVLLTTTASHAQVQTRKGAVLGGLAGAAAGAIIGDNNDEAGAGAAIGGALGVVAGSILGNAQDQQAAQSYAYQRQQQAYAYHRAVSIQDVLHLTRSQVSDSIIVATIHNNGMQRPLEVADIVYLSQNGVSDAVIQSMQALGAGGPRVVRPGPVMAPRPTTVYVEQYRMAPPVVIGYPRANIYYHHGHSGHHGHGSRHW